MHDNNQDNMQEKNKDSSNDKQTNQEGGANEAFADVSGEADPIAALNAENEILAKENAELKEKLLRLAADMENLRKRSAREIGEARTYAIANFARDMLSASDNLSRALSVVPEEALNEGNETLKSLIEGIKMTEREMVRLLEANGIKPISALGEKFDPHKHQAMFEVENSSEPEGTIVEELQQGFAIGERILRPSLVGVAKGNKGDNGEKGNKSKEKLSENNSINKNKNKIDKQA